MCKKKLMMLFSVCFIALSIVACSNDSTPNDNEQEHNTLENNEVEKSDTVENNDTSVEKNEEINLKLTELLPNKPGYVWKYDGSVEYGHEMELITIDESDNEAIYNVEGLVDDASGGESSLDYTIDITYTVTEDSLTQTVDSEVMMDNTFPELELIRLPLSEEQKWTQTQLNADGEEITLESSIDSIENDGEQKIYTVLYEDVDSDYYEKRKIKEGVGVLSFEHLYLFEGDSMPMGYEINYDDTGYSN